MISCLSFSFASLVPSFCPSTLASWKNLLYSAFFFFFSSPAWVTLLKMPPWLALSVLSGFCWNNRLLTGTLTPSHKIPLFTLFLFSAFIFPCGTYYQLARASMAYLLFTSCLQPVDGEFFERKNIPCSWIFTGHAWACAFSSSFWCDSSSRRDICLRNTCIQGRASQSTQHIALIWHWFMENQE